MRNGPSVVLIFALLAVILGGCTDDNPEPEAAPKTSAASRDLAEEPADPNSTHVDLGRGHVQGAATTDELLPLPNVTIRLAEIEIEVLTGSDGRFEFLNVPAGEYVITVNKVGYKSEARRVQVEADETIIESFRLLTLAEWKPYLEIFNNVAYIDYEVGIVSQLYSGVASCEACVWTFETDAPPRNLLIEAFGAHSVPVQPQEEGLTFWLYDNANDEVLVPRTGVFYPVRVGVGEDLLRNTTDYRNRIACHFYNYCFQEEVDIWATASHGRTIPEGYTARPEEA